MSHDCNDDRNNYKFISHQIGQYQPRIFANVAIAMQHEPGNIHQFFSTPRYSATPCYVLIQFFVHPVLDRILGPSWRRGTALKQGSRLPVSRDQGKLRGFETSRASRPWKLKQSNMTKKGSFFWSSKRDKKKGRKNGPHCARLSLVGRRA